MIRKGSMILNSALFGKDKSDQSADFVKADFIKADFIKADFVKILENKQKINAAIHMMIKDDNDNNCVKLRFCSAVLEYEKMIGSELEQKMKNSLNRIFLNESSMFKIHSHHKDIIKIKNEVIDNLLKDQYILNILKEIN